MRHMSCVCLFSLFLLSYFALLMLSFLWRYLQKCVQVRPPNIVCDGGSEICQILMDGEIEMHEIVGHWMAIQLCQTVGNRLGMRS